MVLQPLITSVLSLRRRKEVRSNRGDLILRFKNTIMAQTLLAAVLLIVAVAALAPAAVTAVTYTVGDAAGWNVLGNDAYDNWADNKTFYVGDILVFNFVNGTHDVAEVTEAAYDSCNTTSPISHMTVSPVRITLTTPGEHHYICTFTGHCSRDQKLSIDVLASTTTPAPTPSPSTMAPTPAPSTVAPTPTPTRAPVTYTIGDTAGWNVLGDDAYDTWADNKTFYVGDILVFNFINGTHDVAEVTEAAYDSCNTTSPITLWNTSPVRVTLTTAGEHRYICTFSGHCSRGQKLSIDVLASSATTPSSAPAPTTSAPAPTTTVPSPAPTRAPMTYTVGDAAGWNVLTEDAYDTWADNKTFYVGDTLVFNFVNGTHDVAEVTEAAYDSCNTTSPISLSSSSPVSITLTTAGEHHYICTFSGHCSRGQKLSIDVLASSTTTPSGTTTAPPPSDDDSSASSTGVTAMFSVVLSTVVAVFIF